MPAIAVIAVVGLGWLVYQGALHPSSSPAANAPVEAGLAVGMPAPDMPLPATTGGTISLDSYRGTKVVLYFYEGAG